jgi:uncharacterized protein (DUF1499 family)
MSKVLADLDSNVAKPNWVSSVTKDKAHFLDPMPFLGDKKSSWDKLLKVVKSMSGTKIEIDDGTYMHVTFTTFIMRFVDDVEFIADEASRQIHFKSASRVGHSDLGANKKRMDQVRAAYLA